MQIIDKSYFQKQNFLNIPMSMDAPSGTVTPSNVAYLDLLCQKVEKDILLNALGLELWTEKEALSGTLSGRWKDLIEGVSYDGKVWNGLQYDYSLLAYRVYEVYNTDTAIRLSAIGAEKVNPENATNATPAYLISTANQSFIKQYQGNPCPIIDGIFIDWYDNGLEKSLYTYLWDKKADFPEWNPDTFRFYETINSFGI